MKIRINGDKVIRNVELQMSSDGRTLTIKAVNPPGGVCGVYDLLNGEPKIEVLDSVGTEVKAIYQGAKATAVRMELSGGIPVVTVTLLVSKVSGGDADELRKELAQMSETIASQEAQIAAQTKKIEEQEKAISGMSETVTQAHSAAQTAYDAIKAIEEGIADA